MRNDYEIRGDVTVIYLKRRSGESIETIIDTDDLEKLLKIDCAWYAKVTRNPGVYYVFSGKWACGGKREYLHRVITNAPIGLVVDHLNHDTLNNRKVNLKVVTNQENVARQIKREKTPYSNGDVYWHKRDKRWIARIYEEKKRKWIGSFRVKQDAEAALREHIQNFNNLNVRFIGGVLVNKEKIATIDLNDKSKMYFIKNGKLIPHDLPEYGETMVITMGGQVDRLETKTKRKIE